MPSEDVREERFVSPFTHVGLSITRVVPIVPLGLDDDPGPPVKGLLY